MSTTKTATVYRMVMPNHLCPWGLKTVDLLRRKGYAIDDHHLATRAEVDAFKAQHGAKTTPQTFIEGARIGGYDDLRRHLGLAVRDPEAVRYTPVLVVFAVAALIGFAAAWTVTGQILSLQGLFWSLTIGMCLLAMLKLQDVEKFATMFLNYDLLARRWVPYSYIYPYAELLAGVLMTAGVLVWLAAPLALFIGTVGAASVIKAVYIDRRSLHCACVGGSAKVPLGFVSLTENLVMIAMAVWMLASPVDMAM